MLLAGLLPLIEFSQTPYINQNQLPRGSTLFSGIDPPTLIINQDNKSHRYPEVNIMEAILPLRLLVPMCIKLTTKISHTHTHGHDVGEKS